MLPYRSTVQNHLLRGLDEADFSTIAPALRHVILPVKEVIEQAGETIERIVFPDEGMISIVASASREDELEVGIIGFDGMTGLAVLHGTDRTPERTFVQIDGSGWEMSADDFRAFIAGGPLHWRCFCAFPGRMRSRSCSQPWPMVAFRWKNGSLGGSSCATTGFSRTRLR